MAGAARSADSISCGDSIANPGRNVIINGRSAIVLGDMTTGHGSFPPSALIEANTANVFVNGILACVAGNKIAVHCDSTPTCHDGGVSSYSDTVNIG